MSERRLGDKAIGGYLELESAPAREDFFPGMLAVQSARAALLALVLAGRPRRMWVPWYICETMVDPVRAAGVEIERFGLTEDFDIADPPSLRAGEWLLYVNYFGLCGRNVRSVLERLPPAQVVIDNSHAMFARPAGGLATIYSPRKFVGVPDGGYLASSLAVPVPQQQDEGSVERCIPLLVRAADSSESGYEAFLRSQETLVGQAPLRMSRLTHSLLRSIDYDQVAQRRRANFAALDKALRAGNSVRLDLSDPEAVPLSYPFIGGAAGLRESLLRNRVYVPRYWPQLTGDDPGIPEFERYLAHHCLPLPCDQRYDEHDMALVAALVQGDPQDA